MILQQERHWAENGRPKLKDVAHGVAKGLQLAVERRVARHKLRVCERKHAQAQQAYREVRSAVRADEAVKVERQQAMRQRHARLEDAKKAVATVDAKIETLRKEVERR